MSILCLLAPCLPYTSAVARAPNGESCPFSIPFHSETTTPHPLIPLEHNKMADEEERIKAEKLAAAKKRVCSFR